MDVLVIPIRPISIGLSFGSTAYICIVSINEIKYIFHTNVPLRLTLYASYK